MDKWINPTSGVQEFIEDWSVFGDREHGYMPSGRYNNPAYVGWWNGCFLQALNAVPAFKKMVKKRLAEIAKQENKKLKQVMPHNTYKGKQFKSYRKGMKEEDAAHYEKFRNLKYHYTANKRSIRTRTKVWPPAEQTKGQHKGAIVVRWRSTAPHYNFLRWGFSKGGVQVYEGADWTKWFESRKQRYEEFWNSDKGAIQAERAFLLAAHEKVNQGLGNPAAWQRACEKLVNIFGNNN